MSSLPVKLTMLWLSYQFYLIKGPLPSLVDSRGIVCKTTSILSYFHVVISPLYHIAVLPVVFAILSFFSNCNFAIVSSCRLRNREEQERRGLLARRCLGRSQQAGTIAPSTGNC